TILLKGYGSADTATGAPMTERSGVVIGSTTKALTGVALLQLEQRRLLRLDDPVTRYIPSFRLADQAHAEAITIRQAITHTAGLPPTLSTQTEFLFSDDAADDALARYVDSLWDRVPIGPPGGQWAYANDGFALAGRIIEVVTSRSYEDYMTEEVFAPLGFEDACFAYQRRGEVAAAHDFGPNGEPYPSFFPHSRAASAAGSELILSARDALRWLKAVLTRGLGERGAVLPAELFDEALRPHAALPSGIRGSDGASRGYGLGWEIERRDDLTWIEHGGSAITMGSRFVVVPEKGIAVAVLCNSSSTVRTILGEGIAAILLGREPAQTFPVVDPNYVPDRSRWPLLAGIYEPQVVQNSVPAALPLELDGDRLLAHTYPADHRRVAGDIFLRPVGELNFVLSGRGRTGETARFMIQDDQVRAIWYDVPILKQRS
ncbi:MAG: serine hydrolase domain-containing protein, partial [Chloroflexota bacterium]